MEGNLASGETQEMVAEDPHPLILRVSEIDPSEALQFLGTASAHCNLLGNPDIYWSEPWASVPGDLGVGELGGPQGSAKPCPGIHRAEGKLLGRGGAEATTPPRDTGGVLRQATVSLRCYLAKGRAGRGFLVVLERATDSGQSH